MTHIKCLVIKQENEMAPEHKGQRKSTSCRVVRIFVVVCGETVIVILKKQTLLKLFTLGNTVKTSM